MWVHDGRLDHPLAPSDYGTAAASDNERERLFRDRWQFVAMVDELPVAHDFITRQIFETPVLLRNEGAVRAYKNICAHRHSVVVSLSRGNASSLRCPYHGWEYGPGGRCTKIPDRGSFGDIEPSDFGLLPLRLAQRGDLLFVDVSGQAGDLTDSFDASTLELIDRYLTGTRTIRRWELSHDCDWKIPIENVLETYHVRSLHQNLIARYPQVLRIFDEEDGRSTAHELRERSTTFRDRLGGTSRLYHWLLQRAAAGSTADYEHHHAFPNLILAHSGAWSFVQCVLPTGPGTCKQMVRLVSRASPGLGMRAVWGAGERLAGRLMQTILDEDAAIYERVQQGLRSSEQTGVLSAREERVHAFQAFVRSALDA